MCIQNHSGSALAYADLTGILRGNREVALTAVAQDGEALEYVAFDLKRDVEIVLKAVQQNGDALRFADDSLQNDPYIVKEALSNR